MKYSQKGGGGGKKCPQLKNWTSQVQKSCGVERVVNKTDESKRNRMGSIQDENESKMWREKTEEEKN